ncbi:MAG: CPBP family intramembrane metalloprotease [Caldisericales bacterium]|nr:CPBP family intramembrane metalloprotease [Caldisericales bacterium]
MSFVPEKRLKSVLLVFTLASALALLVSFSRNEWIGIFFSYSIMLASAYLVYAQSAFMTLVGFKPHQNPKQIVFMGFYFFVILIQRTAIKWFSGGEWGDAITASFIILVVAMYERHSLRSFGLTIRNFWGQILDSAISVAIFWCCFTLASIFGPILMGARVTGFEMFFPALDLDLVFSLLYVALVSFASEIFFRGYVQTRLGGLFGTPVSIIIQAILFMLFNVTTLIWIWQPIGVGQTWILLLQWFLFGIALGLLFKASGSLIVTTLTSLFVRLFLFSNNLLLVAQTSSGTYTLPFGNIWSLLLVNIVLVVYIATTKMKDNLA